MDDINIQTLRYISAVERTGSISRAAQQMYVSHSTISRAIRELENKIGITFFQRTSKGVVPTTAGVEFIRQARALLADLDRLESQYFDQPQTARDTLIVASQRYTTVENAFIRFIKAHCENAEYMNLALLEDTPEEVIRKVTDHTCNLGILHYTSDREDEFFEKLKFMDLEWHVLEKSPISIQVRRDHPLTRYPEVTVAMLKDYPHIAYSDEDVTNINFCSDISRFSNSIYKKRIVIQDRGTMRQMVINTDGYYIGVDASRFSFFSETDPAYLHLADVSFTLNTVWVKRVSHEMTTAESRFVAILQDYMK